MEVQKVERLFAFMHVEDMKVQRLRFCLHAMILIITVLSALSYRPSLILNYFFWNKRAQQISFDLRFI